MPLKSINLNYEQRYTKPIFRQVKIENAFINWIKKKKKEIGID